MTTTTATAVATVDTRRITQVVIPETLGQERAASTVAEAPITAFRSLINSVAITTLSGPSQRLPSAPSRPQPYPATSRLPTSIVPHPDST